jgi:hypothetical protein
LELLRHLGYRDSGQHPEGRRLVFVGDLTDRGPDSPAVVNLVQRLVEAGRAQCILGNHEVNLLRGEHKAGNHWFFGEVESMGHGVGHDYPSVLLEGDAERRRMLDFFASLPVALAHDELRVVHACWDEARVELLRDKTLSEYMGGIERVPESGRVRELFDALRPGIHDETAGAPAFHEELATLQETRQMRHPLKVLISGPERQVPSRQPFFAGGTWRFVERAPWWDDYSNVPTVVGHYWRSRRVASDETSADETPRVGPESWWGKGYVYCADFSVGRRHRERLLGKTRGFAGALGALRYPEWEIVFDDWERCGVQPPGANGL